jgi:hypothetical protein
VAAARVADFALSAACLMAAAVFAVAFVAVVAVDEARRPVDGRLTLLTAAP